MGLQINQIIKSKHDGEVIRARIIDSTSAGRFIWLIDIDKDSGMMYRRKTASVQREINNEQAEILDHEPFIDLKKPERAYSDTQKQERDQNYEMIKPLIDAGRDAYNKKFRNKLANQIAKKYDVDPKTVKANFRRFFQRGMMRNAVMPRVHECGGKGQPRASVSTGKKRGRPVTKAAEGEVTNLNITGELRASLYAKMRAALRRKENVKFADIVRAIKAEFYSDGVEISSRTDDDVEYPNLTQVDFNNLYHQLYYHYRTYQDTFDILRNKYGDRRFLTDIRHKPGRSRDIAVGAGSVLVLDATPPNIYLVHQHNRNLVYKPASLWVGRDLATGLVMGIHLSLENESFWSGALALANAMTPKKEFCERFGVNLEEGEWPHCVPSHILYDGGPLSKRMAETYESLLHVDFNKTASFRGDMKGDAEKYFDILDLELLRFLPAFGKWPYSRGERHPALEARHTYESLMKLLIIQVIEYNLHTPIENYPLSSGMIKDDVDPIPIDLWYWSIQNEVGAPRQENPDVIKVNMLIPDQATVTQRGFLFKGLTFTCQRAVDEGWFESAGVYGEWDIDITYDPRTTKWIYLVGKEFDKPIPCTLIENAYNDAFKDSTFYDVDKHAEHHAQKIRRLKHGKEQSRARTKAHVDHENYKAEEEFDFQDDGRSKSARLKNLNENLQDERDRVRGEEAITETGLAEEFDEVENDEPKPNTDQRNISSSVQDAFKRRLNNDKREE